VKDCWYNVPPEVVVERVEADTQACERLLI